MAPVLSFTAEEAWRTIHPRDATIFVHTWRREITRLGISPAFAAKWALVRSYRAEVLKKLEAAREAGEIGSSLQAEVDVVAPAAEYEALARLGDDLRFVFITSAARVGRGATRVVQVRPSTHPKCARCWHYRADVGSDAAHPGLCARCLANLFGSGEARAFA
jgi:isoleucyl-tRNA synthetase